MTTRSALSQRLCSTQMKRLGPVREKINDEHGRDTLEYIRQIQEERVET